MHSVERQQSVTQPEHVRDAPDQAHQCDGADDHRKLAVPCVAALCSHGIGGDGIAGFHQICGMTLGQLQLP